MGRLYNDFFDISKVLGTHNAIRLIVMPRVLQRLGFIRYSYNYAVDKFITDNFKDVVKKYENVIIPSTDTHIPNVIWIFWWQGVENMPSVIKECYLSILRGANGRVVKLISESNYASYVNLPSFIIEKFQNNLISYTHFSDILRVYLLKEFGGLWVDAAIFVTKPIVFPQSFFFSPRISLEKANSPHMSQWVMGVMGSVANMPLFNYIYEMLLAYWKKYDGVFNYLMFDYFIRYGYEHYFWVKEMMDSRPIESPDIHSTRYTFGNEVDEKQIEALLLKNTFLSLTWRITYPLVSKNGKETYYSALLRNCNPS